VAAGSSVRSPARQLRLGSLCGCRGDCRRQVRHARAGVERFFLHGLPTPTAPNSALEQTNTAPTTAIITTASIIVASRSTPSLTPRLP
jgi:hypothetical protein